MASAEETRSRLAGIPNLTVSADARLAAYTRFGIGGPADVYAETSDEAAFLAALSYGAAYSFAAFLGATVIFQRRDFR